jgi:LPS export ABC transporter protein LptC
MSRGQVRFIVALAALLLIGMVSYRLAVSLHAQSKSTRQLEDLLLPGHSAGEDPVDQRMENFRRIKMKDGQKVWEIAARQAYYFEKTGEIGVEAPEVSLYFKDGETIALHCREGRVYLDTDAQEVTRIELKGDLQMRIGDLLLHTQEAVYESTPNIISSTTPVHIAGNGFTVEGQGYTVDVAAKRLTLNAEVQTTVRTGER